MAVRIDSKCYVDVTFPEFEGLVRQNFIMLAIDEDANGIRIPTFNLHLRQTDRSLYRSVSRHGLPVTITYGSTPEDSQTYEFSLISHKYHRDKEGFILEISGLLNMTDFTNKPEILSIKGTSDQVFNQLKYVTPMVDYTGDDEQVWIRHNISEKSFIERTLKHVYIKAMDMPMAALTVNKELVVKSAAKAIKDTPKVKFSEAQLGASPDLIRYDDFTMESDHALWSKFIAEGRTLQVIPLDEREPEILVPEVGSVFDSSIYSYYLENVPFHPVLDCGNTHEKYFQAFINNLSHAAQFLLHNIKFDIAYTFFKNEDLRLLDTVLFIPNNPNNDSFVDTIQGNYILTSKRTVISQKGFKISLNLTRDYHV